jgi:hypothetical protein
LRCGAVLGGVVDDEVRFEIGGGPPASSRRGGDLLERTILRAAETATFVAASVTHAMRRSGGSYP